MPHTRLKRSIVPFLPKKGFVYLEGDFNCLHINDHEISKQFMSGLEPVAPNGTLYRRFVDERIAEVRVNYKEIKDSGRFKQYAGHIPGDYHFIIEDARKANEWSREIDSGVFSNFFTKMWGARRRYIRLSHVRKAPLKRKHETKTTRALVVVAGEAPLREIDPKWQVQTQERRDIAYDLIKRGEHVDLDPIPGQFESYEYPSSDGEDEDEDDDDWEFG